jgi:hypothetical protein
MGRQLTRRLTHRGRRTCAALLFSLLTLALLPRTGVVVHTHADGDHHHVHLDGESDSTHSHHEVGQHSHQHDVEHTHGSPDHHVHGHTHAGSHTHAHTDSDDPFENHHTHGDDDDAHAAGVPQRNPAPVRPCNVALGSVDLDTAAPHWHPQHPYLLYLPARSSVPAVLFLPERYSPTPPRAHKGEPEYLAVARGPPSLSTLPTFQRI